MYRRNIVCALIALALAALPAAGQINTLNDAQQALAAAETAGAPTYAKTLYDDAAWRIKFAQENWNSAKEATKEQARLRADEALWAARAALAKAQWLGMNAAIRSVQGDIGRLGGTSDLTLQDESPSMTITRGEDTKSRIAVAQAAVDQAKAAGAESIPGNDLKHAQQNLETARKIASVNKHSESADHLAYDAEMIARRAYYLARAQESSKYLPTLQMERTRLAQAASEKQAAAERAQREEVQRQAAELQRQLSAEQANRESQAAELERLRSQVDANRVAMEQRIEADRAARAAAEAQLDAAQRGYATAVGTAAPTEVENLRRQVEDQTLALRSIQEREKFNEMAMSSEISALRAELDNAQKQGSLSAQVLAERQADVIRRQQELDQLRQERQADLAHRAEIEKQQQAAVVEAQARRQEAEAKAQQLQEQIDAATKAAQAAQQAAQTNAAELEQTRQQAAAQQAELERTRQELANRDAEAHQLRMEAELAKLAATKKSDRGFIVTLANTLFDTGKTTIKPGAKSTLTKIADQLKGEPGIKVSVEGHTDSVGSEAANQKLSEARSNAVRDFLVGAGLSADRVTAVGKGEAEPVATNKTAAGRQANRRVELVITQ